MNFVRAQKKIVLVVSLMQIFHLILLENEAKGHKSEQNFAQSVGSFKDKTSAYLRAHISLWSWWPIRA